MTDTELVEALATVLRAYATAPLADMEVHVNDQYAYEDTDGAVVIALLGGEQRHIAIGDAVASMMDTVRLSVTAYKPYANTSAARTAIDTVGRQILDVLRQNRAISAGGEYATTNARVPITWEYGYMGDQGAQYRTVTVTVAYEKSPEATSA